ncbi:MAG: hypothetical protein ACOC2N_04440 [Spirochaetota bacterium]
MSVTHSTVPQSWSLIIIDEESRVQTSSVADQPPGSTADFAALPPDSILTRCAPIGIEIDDNEGLILCSETSRPEAWFVSVHEDWNRLQDEVDSLIESGYRPLDLSRDATALAMLWTESPKTAETAPDWRLSSCEATTPVLTRAIHEYGDRGYQLAGLSAHDGLFWLLFARTASGARSSAVIGLRTGDPQSDLTLERTSQSIQSARVSGWKLSGLATTAGSIHLLVSPAP